MRAWFESRTNSEKLLLSVGALVVLGALYFLLLIDPLSQANARLAIRVSAARDLEAHLTQLSQEVKGLEMLAELGALAYGEKVNA